MFQNMKYKIKDTILPIALISFLIFLGYSIISDIKVYYYDSDIYWNLSAAFVIDGKFSFENFPDTYRGYVYPFAIYVFSWIGNIFGNPRLGFMIFNSAVSSLGICSLYLIFGKIDSKKRQIYGTIGLSFLLLYFFKDLVLYPLSDIPAFSFFVLGCYFFKSNETKTDFRRIIFAGMCIYAAYNTRTIYLYPSIFLILWIIFNLLKNKSGMKKIVILMLSTLIGITIVALPQVSINQKYYGINSPKVMTEQYSSGEGNLFIKQLEWGLTYCKYETYVGENNQYSSPALKFEDRTGLQIIKNENFNPTSIFEFLKLYMKYPLDIIGIYSKHVVSYLTPIYRDVYVFDLYAEKGILLIFNIFLFFTAAIYLAQKKIINAIDKKKLPWLVVLLLPCILIIPGAPETRFFIPLYLLLYIYLSYFVNYNEYFRILKTNPVKYIILFVITVAVWTSIVIGILSNLGDPTYIFTIKSMNLF